MNVIFGLVLTLSTALLIWHDPSAMLAGMLSGGEKALSLTLKMVVIYAVWMGVFELLERTGLSNVFAKLLKPINKFLFGKVPDKANDYMSLNISANVLGMSGATTPMGIKAIQELEKHCGTEYAITMFFVINATSVQVIPSSVMALRTTLGSNSPADIILPTILATSISTIVGVLLVKIFIKNKNKCQEENAGFTAKNKPFIPKNEQKISTVASVTKSKKLDGKDKRKKFFFFKCPNIIKR